MNPESETSAVLPIFVSAIFFSVLFGCGQRLLCVPGGRNTVVSSR